MEHRQPSSFTATPSSSPATSSRRRKGKTPRKPSHVFARKSKDYAPFRLLDTAVNRISFRQISPTPNSSSSDATDTSRRWPVLMPGPSASWNAETKHSNWTAAEKSTLSPSTGLNEPTKTRTRRSSRHSHRDADVRQRRRQINRLLNNLLNNLLNRLLGRLLSRLPKLRLNRKQR